ncbi:hypothetical protein [Candidatus Nitrospira bockiana]
MIKILSSRGTESPRFTEFPREPREDNLRWLGRLKRHVKRQDLQLLLVGGRDAMSFRLRIAQAHLRDDFTPSHWSHVMLLGELAADLGATPVYEVSLDPPAGFGFAPPSNGVQKAVLRRYYSAEAYPNIALIQLPKTGKLTRAAVAEAFAHFQRQRAVLDVPDLILRWLAFTWGVGRTGNPLLEGHGFPSAAMLEVVFGAAGYDLTPGLESRSSCPEAIWQAAKWWHEYYRRANQTPPSAWYTNEHVLLDAQAWTTVEL